MPLVYKKAGNVEHCQLIIRTLHRPNFVRINFSERTKLNEIMKKKQLVAAILLTMKIKIVQITLAFIFCSSLYASEISGQEILDKKVSISAENLTLSKVLSKVQKQTGVKFLYSPNTIEADRRISFSIADKTLGVFITEVIKPLSIDYKIVNDQILLFPATTASQNNMEGNSGQGIQNTQTTTSPAVENIVTGTVNDDKGMPLFGATVMVRSGPITTTDKAGKFRLDIGASSAVLMISYTGFITQEINVTANQSITVTLVIAESNLDAVVVTGYTKQSKRDVTGAVSTVNADVVARTPVTDVGSVLQGRVAGVSVDAQGGPGNTAVVRIRGFGSNGNNDVLYVIDGVQMRGGSNLVNPNDIETITILKDPSNTALYGAQGGNGVIVITTKTGKRGASPKLEYNGYVSWETPTNYPKSLSPQEYADTYWNYLKNSGLPLNSQFYGTGTTPALPDYIIERTGLPVLIAAEGSAAVNPALYNLNSYRILKTNKQGTDWFRSVFDQSFSHSHQLTLSGATDKSNYSLGMGYLNNEGTVLGTYFTRYSARINTEFRPATWLRIGENIQFSYTQGSGLSNGNHNPQGLIGDLYQRSTLIPMFDIMGNYSGPKDFASTAALRPGGNNPVLGQTSGRDQGGGYNAGVIGSAFIAIEPMKNLIFESKIGIQFYPYSYRYFIDTFPQNVFSATYNQFTEGGGYSSDIRWTNKLSYEIRFRGIHKISAFAAYESSKAKSRYSQGTVTDLPYTTAGYLNLTNGVFNPTIPMSGGSGYENSISIFGNVNYTLMDKYLFGFVARRDGSSKFGPLNRYGNFFSYSGGWRISKEKFMGDISWLNDLKIRAAYGENGNNAIPPDLYVDRYTLSGYVNYSSYDLNGTNNSAFTGAGLYQLGNPYIHWETNKTTNIGFDAALFRSKLNISFSWFNRITKDLLAVPPITGLRGDALAPFENIMEFSNKGIELELTYNGHIGDISYDIGFNMATYRNNVNFISNDSAAHIDGNAYNPTAFSLTRSVVGMPVSTFFGYIQEGIFQSADDYTKYAVEHNGLTAATAAGHLKFRDLNNDKKINDDDRTFIGNPHPKFSYGFNLNLGYKNFDLGVFLQGVAGNKIFNYWRVNSVFPGAQGAGANDTWSTTNTDAKLPIWNNITSSDAAPSSFFIEDGSYLRLKSLQIGYTLSPKKAFNKIRIYLQGYNLATFTKYTGIDPEISTGSATNIGVDFGGNYPISKKFVLGVNFGL
jgi:TonB-linked SusC/RagA family outer membrane protein